MSLRAVDGSGVAYRARRCGGALGIDEMAGPDANLLAKSAASDFTPFKQAPDRPDAGAGHS